MELLLVLGLLAVIAALVWPAVERPFGDQRLRAAADSIRADWCQARIEAIRSGSIYCFRFSPEGSRYSIEPQGDPTEGLAGVADAPTPVDAQSELDSSTTSDVPVTRIVEKTLPDKIVFAGSEPANSAAIAAEEGGQSAASEEEGSQADLSESILFYPDGTTSDAQLVLTNDRGRTLTITLRGLTGSAVTGDVLTSEEPPP